VIPLGGDQYRAQAPMPETGIGFFRLYGGVRMSANFSAGTWSSTRGPGR